MKDIFMKTRNGILKIRSFTEEYPEKAEKLELFTFTENPWGIEDLLKDLETAIAQYEEIDLA